MAPAASPLTVGEVTANAGLPRALVVIVAINLPPLFIAASFVAANYIYSTVPELFTTSGPWWLIMTWGIFATLVLAVAVFMNLCVPRAPFAMLQDVINIGVFYIGIPLLVVVTAAVLYGQTWMLVVLACILAALITGVVAFWVWVIRTYN